MILASGMKGPGADHPAGYWTDLLRGYELVNGLETPPLNRAQVEGREQELRVMWLEAPLPDKCYVERQAQGWPDQDDRCPLCGHVIEMGEWIHCPHGKVEGPHPIHVRWDR